MSEREKKDILDFGVALVAETITEIREGDTTWGWDMIDVTNYLGNKEEFAVPDKQLEIIEQLMDKNWEIEQSTEYKQAEEECKKALEEYEKAYKRLLGNFDEEIRENENTVYNIMVGYNWVEDYGIEDDNFESVEEWLKQFRKE